MEKEDGFDPIEEMLIHFLNQFPCYLSQILDCKTLLQLK